LRNFGKIDRIFENTPCLKGFFQKPYIPLGRTFFPFQKSNFAIFQILSTIFCINISDTTKFDRFKSPKKTPAFLLV